MILTVKNFLKCYYKALVDTVVTHDGIEHSGYLAFLSLLSFFPFLVFFVALAGYLGDLEIGREFVHILISALPEHMVEALKPRIEEILSGPPQSLLTLAIIGTIWTASSTVEGMRTILNRAYRVATPPAYIWRRLMSIIQFLIMTFAVFCVMVLQILAPVFWQEFRNLFGVQEALFPPGWTYIRYGFSGLVVFVVVTISYYVLPNIRQRWQRVAPGALIVLVLWLGATELLSAYVSRFQQVNLVYGSLAGIIIALLYFYVSWIIYVYGAEFNYHLERALGHRFEQKEAITKPHKQKKKP